MTLGRQACSLASEFAVFQSWLLSEPRTGLPA